MRQDSYRSLTLFLGFWCSVSNFTSALLFQRVPDDPLHIATHLSIYYIFASALAVLGIIGAKKRNATLVTIFVNYLFIDTVLSILPRLIIFTFFPALRSQLCSADSIHAWLQSQAMPEDLLESQPGIVAQEMVGQCQQVVVVLQVLLGVVVVGSTIVQVLLALRVSRFGSELRKQEALKEFSETARLAGKPVICLQDEKRAVLVDEMLS